LIETMKGCLMILVFYMSIFSTSMAMAIAPLYQQHRDLFEDIDTLSFNIFNFIDKVGHNNTLPLISYHILKHHGVLEELDSETLEKFIREITLGYKKTNPYHNDIHAADTLQMAHFILLASDVKRIAELDNLDIIAFLLSAIVHDYKHPGLNSNFLISSQDDLALTYNDISVLENMHISETFKMVKEKPETDIFKHLKTEDRKKIRRRMIGMVLGTDMAHHGEHVSALKSVISEFQIQNGSNAELITRNTTDKNKQMLLDCLVHAADISNPTRPFLLSQKWTYNLIDENWKQCDFEKEKGLPASLNCTQQNAIPNSPLGFLEHIILPYFEPLTQIFVGLTPLLQEADNNFQQ
jgi:calcium/calmodulin-dependent 3',5'-cyclic nucleotide phosphodiesterase